MAGAGPRYRFVLVQEPATTLPVRYRSRRPTGEQTLILEVVRRLEGRHGRTTREERDET